MAITLHNYFDDQDKIIKDTKALEAKVDLDPVEKNKKQLNIFKPLIEDSSELFYRDTNNSVIRDKLVYVFFDGSDPIRTKKVNADWDSHLPVAYIGMGETLRPFNHWKNDLEKVNFRFREWLESMKRDNRVVYLMIYAMHMSDTEAKNLEADLLSQVIKIQSPQTGMAVYKKTRCPTRLYNSKHETSNQKVYSIYGRRQKEQLD